MTDFIDICKDFEYSKTNNLDRLRQCLSSNNINLGVFKHWTRRFIQRDDLDIVKIMYSYEKVNNSIRWDFFNTIINYDSVTCFLWVVENGYYMPEFDFTFCTNHKKPVTISKILTAIVKNKFVTQPQIQKMFECIQFALSVFFIECIKSGVTYNYDTVWKFAQRGMLDVVSYLLNKGVEQPTDQQVQKTRFGIPSYRILSMLCAHSNKVWEVQTRKSIQKILKLWNDDYNKLRQFPLLLNGRKMPVYLTYELIQKVYPKNVWLIPSRASSVLKLIEQF